ncbi:MAG: ABC transporter ATP-binding protein [Desulfofustis sp.]|jgi:ABC-type lipoprotein export system ATPase subunit|nr:ABC transporter ATP-binding protein [Desulfofustis sp.]
MLEAIDIKKSFSSDGKVVPVLEGISLKLDAGDYVSIVGRSGSGKTTLLNVISTLVRPDSGEITYEGVDLASVPESHLNGLRKSDFSVIFQFHHLLPYLTVLENTLLPFMNSLKPVSRQIEARALECLVRVGLADKARRLPGSLSGGEQQRVAIARALVKSSKILFADEPTGSLDQQTGDTIMELLAELHRDGMTIVMVTHEMEYARLADRIVEIEDGRIVH